MQNQALSINDDLKVSKAQLAQKLKACADPLRLVILQVMSRDSYNVQELCHILSIKQSALSHHLKLLADAGFLTTRREGNTIYYRRLLVSIDDHFYAFSQSVNGMLDDCLFESHHLDGLARVEQDRIASSKQFFIQNAKKLRKQQDLIASFPQYGDAVAAFIRSIHLPSRQHAVEIGPGEGLFLQALSQQFEHVSAFDISAQMVKEAGEHIASQALKNVQVFLGDAQKAKENTSKADCIVLNMVLHHVASPSDMFLACGQLLKNQGGLIITDLCHHDQVWAKTSCGDVWLGFEPEDLSLWAAQSGLAEGESSYLAQRNGFRIQTRHFFKIEEER